MRHSESKTNHTRNDEARQAPVKRKPSPHLHGLSQSRSSTSPGGSGLEDPAQESTPLEQEYGWVADVLRDADVQSSCRDRLVADFSEAIGRRSQLETQADVTHWVRRAIPKINGPR